MYYQVGQGKLYRVTRSDATWPQPVQGIGAFYLPEGGNRYNVAHQQTVSCSEDPLVAITEAAYYQACNWRKEIAGSLSKALTYPLRSEHLFWAFTINPGSTVLNLTDPIAITHFRFSPLVLTNPGQNYFSTQTLATNVRNYKPPVGSQDPIPEGLYAPSVRTPTVGTYRPMQIALFVMDPGQTTPYDQRSTLVARMRLEIEFTDDSRNGSAVGYQSVAINWNKPKYRLSVIPGEPSLGPIPCFTGRPSPKPISLNRWLVATVCY